jgi:hypothetical protein
MMADLCETPMDSKLLRVSEYLSACKAKSDFNPMAIAPLLPYVFVLEIERGVATLQPRLRVRLMGGELDIAFGRSLVGKYLETFIHGPRGGEVIEGFHDCANTHEPLWMRQIVQIQDKSPRFVEGVLFYLAPERIYGALLVGSLTHDERSSFERKSLRSPAGRATIRPLVAAAH